MSHVIDNLTVENSIDAPLSTQVNSALSNKYDASNPSGFQTAAQVTTAANNAVTTANAFTTAQINALVAASPSTLDTLDELAAALGDDPNFAASTATALGNRLRVDTAAQGLSGTQKTNAKTNIDLQNCDNTSDANKPVSTATQTALNLKYDASNPNNYETPTQLNTRDTNNRARANHTGTQAASSISDFAATVRSTVLTGLSLATGTAVTAADSVLQAIGKIQTQIDVGMASLNGVIAGKADKILTGLSIADSADVADTDTVLIGIGKLQAQQNLWNEYVTTSVLSSTSGATLTNITELSQATTAGKKYYLEYTIIFRTAATNTGVALSIAWSGSGSIAAVVNIPVAADGTNALLTGSITTPTDTVVGTGVQAASTNYIATIRGVFSCSADGSVYPQFRSEGGGVQVQIIDGSVALIREF